MSRKSVTRKKNRRYYYAGRLFYRSQLSRIKFLEILLSLVLAFGLLMVGSNVDYNAIMEGLEEDCVGWVFLFTAFGLVIVRPRWGKVFYKAWDHLTNYSSPRLLNEDWGHRERFVYAAKWMFE